MLSVATDLYWSDLAQLRDHVKVCAFSRGRMHRLRCAIEAIDEFVSARFVTTLTTLTLVFFAGLSLPA